MPEKLLAVAFDIDGTLYPSWKLSCRMFLYAIRNCAFFLAFNRTRRRLHARSQGKVKDFYALQAELLSQELMVTPEEARARVDKIVYSGFKPFFERVPPYRGARETIAAFKDAGLKIALMSDFPTSQKGDVWGIAPLCDALIDTEKYGALKPHPAPFQTLIDALGVPPETILYVGNSVKYDVRGARAVGLKTAYILPLWRRILSKPHKEADISFKNYRQLRRIVLE